MKKFKSNPDIAVLVLRLALAAGYLFIFSLGIQVTSFSELASTGFGSMILPIIALTLYSLGSILLILGIFTRTVSVIFALFILFLDIMNGTQAGQLIQSLFDVHLWTLVAIFMIGGGKYSLDQKIFSKKVQSQTQTQTQ